MRVTYDPIADALYIYLSSKKSTSTRELGDLLVDFVGNKAVGIEVLNVSKKLSKKDLGSITLSIPTAQDRSVTA